MKHRDARVLGILFAALPLAAQQPSEASDRDLNLQAYIELLRSDVKSEKVEIITEVMDLDEADAAKFWPIYRQYEADLTKLGDIKLELIKDYAEHYETLTDAKARELGAGALDLESKRTELKKRYFERFSDALSPKIAARFLQVDNQIQMLLDLQVASLLPVVRK